MERLVKEAEELAEQGVKELILVAQETTLYGTDLYGKKSLHLLLKELCKIKGIRWIRVQYCYPEEIYDELIQTIKEENAQLRTTIENVRKRNEDLEQSKRYSTDKEIVQINTDIEANTRYIEQLEEQIISNNRDITELQEKIENTKKQAEELK